MPELPEVETVVRELRPYLVGKRLGSVQVGRQTLRRGWSAEWKTLLPGRRVVSIDRRGKWIIVTLDRGRLLVHLGMTGQFTAGPAKQPVQSHTHLIVALSAGRQLRFRDPRRFGSVSHFADAKKLAQFLDDRLGPEPFDLECKAWRESLHKTGRAIKAALLDQAIVAGVGNIYADESLFLAKIHPATPAHRLTSKQAEKLRKTIPRVLTFAIERRGSSIRDYVGGSGESGSYQQEFRVYGRVGEPCMKCRASIQRIRLAGRSTHFCPQCQACNG